MTDKEQTDLLKQNNKCRIQKTTRGISCTKHSMAKIQIDGMLSVKILVVKGMTDTQNHQA